MTGISTVLTLAVSTVSGFTEPWTRSKFESRQAAQTSYGFEAQGHESGIKTRPMVKTACKSHAPINQHRQEANLKQALLHCLDSRVGSEVCPRKAA